MTVLAGDDHERQVDDDIGAVDERVDGRAIEHVTAVVLDLAPAECLRIERPAGHRDDPPDLLKAVERRDEGDADLTGRARDRNRELLGRAHAPEATPRGVESARTLARQEPATRAISASDVTPVRTFARPSSRIVRMPEPIAAAVIASPEASRMTSERISSLTVMTS